MPARTKKLINHPNDILSEMLEGYAAAYSDIIQLQGEHLIVRTTPKVEGNVALIIGNGTGHEPAMIGWIGEGLFDVNVAGPLFTAPGPFEILEGIKAADRGAGVLLCVSHHEGDRLNAEAALEFAKDEGINNVDLVLLYDDVASAPKGEEAARRGTAGLFFTWKMLGAFAETSNDLAACKALAEKVRDNTRSLSMALDSCASPITGEPMFELADDEIEIGMGIHGEAGMYKGKLLSADEIIDQMLPGIVEDLPFVSGDQVCVLINNAGSLTIMELSILYRRVQQRLDEMEISVHKAWLGQYATTQEMAGFGLSLCRVDHQLKALYDAPANGAFFKM
ncbi:MAG: dihydroxyacetone kinase subunit DhaK [Chloroflexota bacterium]